MSEPRVLAFGAWDLGTGYPRTPALFEGLRRRGVTVVECRIDLPYAGVAKRRLLARPWSWPGYWWSLRRARATARRALAVALTDEQPDVVLVPYPGHLVVRWVRSVWRGPLVLDLFLSAYDTAVIDRAVFREGSIMAQFMRRIDRRACSVADRVLVDTDQNAAFVADLVDLPAARFAVVPVSDPAEVSEVLAYEAPGAGETLEVLFFGTGVPLHGLASLLDALQHCERVRLSLVGGSDADRARARRLPANKLRLFDPFVPADELRRCIDRSHLVAGVFGTSPRADRVIPFKVMHGLAAGRPVITARTTAVGGVLRNGVDCVLVSPGDSLGLAAALQELADEPWRLADLADAARLAYERFFSLERVGSSLVGCLRELVPSADNPGEQRERDPVTSTETSSCTR